MITKSALDGGNLSAKEVTFVIMEHVTVLYPLRPVSRQLADFSIKKAWMLEKKQRDQVFVSDHRFVSDPIGGPAIDEGYELNGSFSVIEPNTAHFFDFQTDLVNIDKSQLRELICEGLAIPQLWAF